MTEEAITAYPANLAHATAYLARDPVDNAELLVALRYDADVRCIGAFRSGGRTSFGTPNTIRDEVGGRLSSLLSRRFARQAGKPATTEASALVGVLVVGREGIDDRLTARFAADDADALRALIAKLPRGVSRIAVQRAWMLPVLEAALRLSPEGDAETAFSLTTPPTLPTFGVRPLTMADAPMMAASATLWGRAGLADAVRAGFRPFGIVRDDRVVTCAMAANVTDWTEEVMSVWTAPRHRGQGLATAVVAATAADIAMRGKTAIYVAAVTNHASQRVAEKVGFQRAYNIAAYRIRS